MAEQALAENEGYSIGYASGKITFDIPPAEFDVVTAGFEFDVPVRFDTDQLEINSAGFEAGEIPSIPIVELRL